MKTALALAVLLSVAPLSASTTDAEFDHKEKISLDLKDARLTDVVTTLGALANMPVSIDSDVSGTMTIQLVDVPFDKVLKIISGQTGVSVRIENGKLVASRSSQASSAAAVALPDEFHDAPRTRVADVAKSAPTIPVFVRTKWNGEQSCHRLDFIDGKRPTISFRAGRDEAAPSISVTQFAFDPVSHLRYLALDGAGLPGSVAIGGSHAVAKSRQSETEALDVFLWEKPESGCTDETLREEPPSQAMQLYFLVREVVAGGAGEIVMAPSIQLLTGTTFRMRTSFKDEKTGQQRELVLSGYLSRDGAWAAVNLMATAIWTDSTDGIEYFFTQSSIEASPTPVVAGEVLAATLSAGVAAPRPLELRMFKASEGKPAPAPRAN